MSCHLNYQDECGLRSEAIVAKMSGMRMRAIKALSLFDIIKYIKHAIMLIPKNVSISQSLAFLVIALEIQN